MAKSGPRFWDPPASYIVARAGTRIPGDVPAGRDAFDSPLGQDRWEICRGGLLERFESGAFEEFLIVQHVVGQRRDVPHGLLDRRGNGRRGGPGLAFGCRFELEQAQPGVDDRLGQRRRVLWADEFPYQLAEEIGEKIHDSLPPGQLEPYLQNRQERRNEILDMRRRILTLLQLPQAVDEPLPGHLQFG